MISPPRAGSPKQIQCLVLANMVKVSKEFVGIFTLETSDKHVSRVESFDKHLDEAQSWGLCVCYPKFS